MPPPLQFYRIFEYITHTHLFGPLPSQPSLFLGAWFNTTAGITATFERMHDLMLNAGGGGSVRAVQLFKDLLSVLEAKRV